METELKHAIQALCITCIELSTEQCPIAFRIEDGNVSVRTQKTLYESAIEQRPYVNYDLVAGVQRITHKLVERYGVAV